MSTSETGGGLNNGLTGSDGVVDTLLLGELLIEDLNSTSKEINRLAKRFGSYARNVNLRAIDSGEAL